MTQEAQEGEHQGYRVLRYACILYGIGLLAHGTDHLRRGTDVLTPEVLWAGALTTVMGLILIAVVFSRHRLAPLAAAAFGFSNAAGVAAGPLPPPFRPVLRALSGGA